MEKTKNYHLLKPGVNDFYDVGDFNQNVDIVDEALKQVEKDVQKAVDGLDKKVDQASGKGLSTNDFTNAYKQQVDVNKQDIANLQNNKYVHPTYASRPSGLYKTTVDSTGHISSTTAVTANDLPTASIMQKGVVQLEDSVASTATNKAATPSAVKQAYDQAICNHNNVLINPDFQVNQRGETSYLPGRYSVDRWIISAGKLDVIPGGVRLTYANGALLYQSIEKHEMERLMGKTLTLSLQKTDGTIVSGTVTLPKAIPKDINYYRAYQASNMLMEVVVGSDSNTYHLFRLSISEGSAINIARVKLELGSVSTLANDPPANYGEQLALCQRYYFNPIILNKKHTWLGYMLAEDEEYGLGFAPLPTTMRLIPSFTADIAYLWGSNGSTKVKIYPETWNHSNAGVGFGIRFPESPLVPGKVYMVHLSESEYVAFDAEIY